jgi:hypothetical protein
VQRQLEWQSRLEEERERLAAEREARVESEVGQRLTQLFLHRQLTGELPAWTARLAPEVIQLLDGPRESQPSAATGRNPGERAEEDELPEAVAMRRRFMEEHVLRGVDFESREGEDWLGSADLFRLIRRDAGGKPAMGQTRAREVLREIGKLRQTRRGRQVYVAPFDQVMRTLAERSLLDEETLSWWNAYHAAGTRSSPPG